MTLCKVRKKHTTCWPGLRKLVWQCRKKGEGTEEQKDKSARLPLHLGGARSRGWMQRRLAGEQQQRHHWSGQRSLDAAASLFCFCFPQDKL